jgi:hypothetical protein
MLRSSFHIEVRCRDSRVKVVLVRLVLEYYMNTNSIAGASFKCDQRFDVGRNTKRQLVFR